MAVLCRLWLSTCKTMTTAEKSQYESNYRTNEFTDVENTDSSVFSVFLVGIRYFSVFVIPTSVSVSVFENTAVSVRYRYYRPRPGHLTPSSFWLIPTLQLPTVDVRNVGPLCEYKHAESQTFSKFIDNSVTVLLQTNPDFNRLLLEFIHILERSMIDLLLHDAPELLIDRIEVRAVGTTDLER